MLLFYYEDAKEQYEKILNINNTLIFSSYNSPIPSQAIIENSIIDRLATEDSDRANLDVILQFKEYVQGNDGMFTSVSRTLNLIFFNPEGDSRWTARMKARVWRNKYPDSVAIDKDSGEVFLVFFLSNGTMELCHYSRISLDTLEGILISLNHNEPYYIFLDDTAMFNVIDGAEGYNHLFENTYIVFNSSQEVKVYRRTAGEELGNAVSIIKTPN